MLYKLLCSVSALLVLNGLELTPFCSLDVKQALVVEPT